MSQNTAPYAKFSKSLDKRSHYHVPLTSAETGINVVTTSTPALMSLSLLFRLNTTGWRVHLTTQLNPTQKFVIYFLVSLFTVDGACGIRSRLLGFGNLQGHNFCFVSKLALRPTNAACYALEAIEVES